MKKPFCFLAIFSFLFQTTFSQSVVLSANSPGDTYELINSVLALPNRDVVEEPDCNHTDFGRHIDEVFDDVLNKNVFRFHIHVTPDNDRCKPGIDDRQRNEIKTYNDSPENLKAVQGETVIYKWKFKISSDFQPSSSFTHIHQIKAVGGSYASIPMITLTLRKASPDRLELRYTPTNNQTTLETANLNLFKGNWAEVTEVITFGNTGSYSIEIKNIATDAVLLTHTDNPLDTWQDGAEFARPKWGIYRSLNNSSDLKDEIVKFADFSVEEMTDRLSVEKWKKLAANIILYPNPSSKEITFKNATSENYNSIEIYDSSGRKMRVSKKIKKNKLDVSRFSKGLYFIVFKKDTLTTKVLKCYVK